MSNKIVAQVNGKNISQADVMKFIEDIGPQVAMQFQSPDGIKKIIEEMISQELLLLDSKANKLDEEEEFLRVLEETKDNLLKSYGFSNIIKDIKITEEEARDLYENNRSAFAKDLVRAKHILVETEDLAWQIRDQIKAGKSFEEMAKEYSSCPSRDKGGDLGEFGRGQMVAEFDQVAFEQEAGQISEPVRTQFGYHLILTLSKTQASDLGFEDLRSDVEREALRLKQLEAYQKKIGQLKEQYDYKIFD